MITQLIGLKQFRNNIATYSAKAQKRRVRFIVLKRNIPVFEVLPIDEKEFARQKLATEIAVARKEVKKGKVYSQKQIMKEFGLL